MINIKSFFHKPKQTFFFLLWLWLLLLTLGLLRLLSLKIYNIIKLQEEELVIE